MSSIFSIPELAIGVGLSEAASAAFEPKVEVPKQTAWLNNPQRVPDLGLIAELVAGGKVTPAAGHNMANRLGYSNGTMDSLVWLAQNRLNFPLMLRMWRLSAVNPAFDAATLSGLVDETLAHERLDWGYRGYLRALKTAELPGIGDIAYGVVRGILPAPSWVPVAPPTTTTNVKRFPMVNIDPVQLAAALGYDEDMLRLMVGRSGLSLAPGLAAQAFFRGLIADDDYHLAIAEGDLRTEWADILRAASRQIPSTLDYTEAHLRGWISQQAMYDGAARHGTSQADTQLMYEVRRRPLSVPTITKALARGGTFDATQAPFADPYVASVHEANLGPEWYDLAEHMKYTYPSAFVLRALLKDGAIAAAEASQIMQYEGYPPALADKIAGAYAPTGATVADPHVTKAENQLWTTTHKSYVAHEISDATATTALTAAGVTAAAVTPILTLWQTERDLIRKSLSAAQIKKAYTTQTTNPATGGAWTLQDAIARLLELGYDQADATVLLEE